MIANQFSEFKRAVNLLEPLESELADAGLVQLALALEGVNRQDDAIAVLSRRSATGTDPLGVLAGRFKRRWLLQRTAEDGKRAKALYEEGLQRATAKQDQAQVYYHGINVAFLRLAMSDDLPGAREMARRVLDACRLAEATETNVGRKWRLATEGEALLMLGDTEAALVKYRLAVAPEQGASPRELDSMYQQAVYVSRLVADAATTGTLAEIFRNTKD